MVLEMMGGAGQKVPGGPENLVASILDLVQTQLT